MALLFESELSEAPLLCFQCAEIYEAEKLDTITCPACGFSVSWQRYRDFYGYAFYASRYGVQYRRFYDQDESPAIKPFLEPLGDIATFVALAALSGLIGNASYDVLRSAVQKIISQSQKSSQPGKIQIREEEVEDVIRFVMEFEKKGLSTLPERIQNELAEEMMGDALAENPIIGKKIIECIADPTEANKRKAAVLYREVARRIKSRQQRRPSAPSWKFWSRL